MNDDASAQHFWTRETADGRLVHSDTAEHVRLVTRTLGIDEAAWASTLDRYTERVVEAATVDDKLAALAGAFLPAQSCAVPVSEAPPVACPLCRTGQARPLVARSSGATKPALVYGRCDGCGHGVLLRGAVSSDTYDGDYYERRREDGTGYDLYRSERPYRESKAARLLDWLEGFASIEVGRPTLLEVGSGFGFTRAAASARGWQTVGVDVSPAAARGSEDLYGLPTITATLGQALDSGRIEPHRADLVLYQFVLEHIEDPKAELRRAFEATRPGGYVLFVVPTMSTFEVEVFRSSYRSLRADSLHLFSVASARACAEAAGFAEVTHQTTCSIHLLRGLLRPAELDELYQQDLGPDLLFLARAPCAFPSS